LHKYIEIYRDHGHHYSQINPLNPSIEPKEVINPLDLKINYNDPLNQSLFADESFLICENQIKSVKELESSLKKVYCGTVGVEFSHIRDQKERDWLYYNYERIYSQEFTKTQKLNIISSLIQTEAIDHFLQKKFNTFVHWIF
jgi:2-oxoglutarate dehydrogenase complex dehydrogenase (E1) component-like enzyme